MLRTITINNNISITNANFSRNPRAIIQETVTEKYKDKLISNYIVLDATVKHVGMVSPSLEKHIIAIAAVSIECQILFVPDNSVIPRCKFIGVINQNSDNSDQIIYHFQPLIATLSDDQLARISLFVANNGLSGNEIKQLANLEIGDIISLFVTTSVAYFNTDRLGCISLPNFDGAKSPVFMFNSLQIKEFDGVKADTSYVMQGGKLIEAKDTKVKPIDFLSTDDLKAYIADLASFA